MKKFAQILYNKVHWVLEAESMPEFSSDIVIKDITDLADQPEEGWDYDAATNTFTTPVIQAVPIVETTEQKISQLQADNLVLMDALATTFEEVLALRALVEGGTA